MRLCQDCPGDIDQWDPGHDITDNLKDDDPSLKIQTKLLQ